MKNSKFLRKIRCVGIVQAERRSNARRVIESVFAPILAEPAASLTLDHFSRCMRNYKRKRIEGAVSTANGQVSPHAPT